VRREKLPSGWFGAFTLTRFASLTTLSRHAGEGLLHEISVLRKG
jgi:hypothetical protein